ncbi:MAG: hypothetical protein V7641_3106 [Blastocatellia bacterium]
MRYIFTFVMSLACFSCAAMTSLAAPPQASNMTATMYDDGKSCPNNCDAHVVFNPRHNGTRNAFDPSSSRSAPRRCIAGQPCKICFSADDSSCMLATYRGGGPAVGRFDFTPAFYEENCPKPNLPAAFARQCRSAQPAIAMLKNQINCIANPEDEKCKALMKVVVKRKADDDVLYEECKTLGEVAFNQKYRNQPGKQRSNNCAYEQLRTGGPNRKGERWRRLLDGACRPGTYVGRDGLDCCSGSLYAAAMLGSECKSFFVSR